MRRKLVAGNWKMNGTLAGARELVAGICEGVKSEAASGGDEQLPDVLICPPAYLLFPMAKAVDGTPVALGAQNYDNIGRLNGKPAAIVAIYQLPGSNAIATMEAAR
ncbi:MAG: triose-phosphate isomerase, partial [Phycisphaerae bacterium]